MTRTMMRTTMRTILTSSMIEEIVAGGGDVLAGVGLVLCYYYDAVSRLLLG